MGCGLHQGIFTTMGFHGYPCWATVEGECYALTVASRSEAAVAVLAIVSWGKATAALLIIGFILLIICFILSFVALCVPNMPLMRIIGAILILAVILQVIALIIYPVRFTNELATGNESYLYSWTYGFGWGSTIIMFGCAIFFCCLPNYEDELLENVKTKYFYTSA
ncbi:p53 apoptosis effector related to PMP-22 isoform X1 [Xenopus tropicalis]|uniref:P53 apoptosis effector related to PMP-22 isoform X1 n=1 Tax=Xenopus tropicalis TaxID=8364 RepID=A0A803JM69_XENTR|nr:p53 apoptosis effector related to PMP-22 isoform X1 [Xenopus tropicalis]|eukprot:XP_017949364.1 PREDICTED: p53 apoptosis effector related to PMP-22 isoform X1 [Xenopus tropicalis]